MTQWTVTLSGDSSKLRLLVALEVDVTVEGGAFVFRSRNLDSLTDSRAVQKRAAELIEVRNGVARTAEKWVASK